jgi:RNA polymerase sigma-70 factor (ECF subfamily)
VSVSAARLKSSTSSVYAPAVRGSQPGEHWYSSADDAALMRRACEDDVRAFDEIAARYQDILFTCARRICGSPEEAEEAVQDALFAAWRARTSFRGDSKVSTWLITITRRKTLDRISGRGDALPFDEVPESAHTAAPASDTGVAQRLDLHEALLRISVEHREVLVLAHGLDLTMAQIAEVTGLPENTVKTRLHRARAALARVLGSEDDD